MDPKAQILGGEQNNGADFGNPGNPAPPVDTPKEPEAPTEPTVAEMIADGLKGVTEHMDARFAESEASIDAKLAAANAKPEPGTPDPAATPPAWQPKSWDDFPKLVEDLGQKAAEKVIAERDAKAKAAADEVTAFQKGIDDEIDRQTKDLIKEGRLPEIKDAADANDPGKLALRELYGIAAWAGTPDLSKAQTLLDKYHSAGMTFDVELYQKNNNGDPFVKGNPVAPGKTAPVGSSSANAGRGGVTNLPTYEDIAKAGSLSELVDRFS